MDTFFGVRDMLYEKSGNLVNPPAVAVVEASVTDRMYIRILYIPWYNRVFFVSFPLQWSWKYTVVELYLHTKVYLLGNGNSGWWPANFSIAQFMFLLSCALGGWRVEAAAAASFEAWFFFSTTLLFYCTFLSQRHFALLGAGSSGGDYRWLRSAPWRPLRPLLRLLWAAAFRVPGDLNLLDSKFSKRSFWDNDRFRK